MEAGGTTSATEALLHRQSPSSPLSLLYFCCISDVKYSASLSSRGMALGMSFPGGLHSWGQAPDVQAEEAPQQPNLFFLSKHKMLTQSNAALLTSFSHWVCCTDRACSSDSGKGKQRPGTVPLESPLAPFPSQNGSSLTLLGYQLPLWLTFLSLPN